MEESEYEVTLTLHTETKTHSWWGRQVCVKD